MIIHPIRIVASGRIAELLPHAGEPRDLRVEVRGIPSVEVDCQRVDCDRQAVYETIVHVGNSRRTDEPVYLCAEDVKAHRLGETLRIVLEPRS